MSIRLLPKLFVSLAALFLAASPVQADFKDLVRDAGHLLSFPVADDAAPYGIPGFDVGFGYVGASVAESADDSAHWNLGYVRAVKGLPFSIDVGGMYGTRLGGDEAVAGGELRWAILDGGITLPAIGTRVAYTQSMGSDAFNLRTVSGQLHISKGFPFVTPFAGGGYSLIVGNPGDAGIGLDSVTAGAPHAWAGVSIAPFPFVSLVLKGQMGFAGAPVLFITQLSAGL